MPQPEIWTIKRLLEWTTDFFKKKGFDTPRLEAEILLSTAMHIKRIALYTQFESEPTETQRTAFREFVKRRGSGEPVAYLAGFREFYSLPFNVDKRVLIPRPETEHLVLEAIDFLKTLPEGTNVHVADVGTGSGAIAVALAKNAPKNVSVKITAVDISSEALTAAKENAEQNGIAEKITFVQSDLFNNVQEKFGLIISNPPYVSQAEYDALPPDVKNFEPRQALLAGEKGTEIIEKLIEQAEKILNAKGLLLIEGSPMILPSLASQLEASGRWYGVRIINDNAGLQRIIAANKP
jgi:release factor glutamine methyltransferase